METQFSNPLPIIEVRKRRPSAFKGMKKAFCIISGIVGFIVGFFLLFTIILIPLSIFIWMGSMALFAAAGDQYQVSCPSCKKKMIVGNNQEDFKCKRCSQPTIINWIDYK